MDSASDLSVTLASVKTNGGFVPYQIARKSICNGKEELNGTTAKKKTILILTVVFIMHFIIILALSIMAPFFPVEASRKGTNTTMSGLVFSMYGLVVFLASPILGSVVAKFGARNLMLMGVLLTGVSNILFGLLHYVEDQILFFVSCLVLRSFEGVGLAGYNAAAFGLVGELCPENVGTVVGILEIIGGAGLTAGPAIGGFLFDWGGYGLPFYAVGVALLVTIPVGLVVLPVVATKDKFDEKGNKVEEKSSWEILKLKPVLITVIYTFVFSISWGYKFPTLEPHLREFNLSAKEIGSFFLIPSAFYAITGPIVGYFTDRMKRPWISMVAGLVVTPLGLVILGPSPLIGIQNSIWSNIVALVLVGIAASLAMIPVFKTMLDAAVLGGYSEGSGICGLIGGLWTSSFFLGEVVGPAFGAFLTDQVGFAFCSDVIAAICFLTAILLFVYFQFFLQNPSKLKFVLPK